VHANAPLTAEGRRRLVARVLVLGPPRLGRRPAAASYLDRADRELGRALGRGLAPAQRRAVGAANPAWAVCRTVGRGGRLQSADDDGVELGLQPSAEVWGQGYAQEVAAAGRRCAQGLRPDLPITAVVASRNRRSQRAIERAGLSKVWRGPDNKDPDPSSELLLYADRVLSEEQVRVLTA